MKTQPLSIYHLVPAGYYRSQPQSQPYQSQTFTQEGFIHCTVGVDMLVEIANLYFGDLSEPLLALEINPNRLTAPLKFEPPIHPAGQSSGLDETAGPDHTILFPHIYGPLNREAIVDNFVLRRDETGQWQIPI